MNIIYRKDLTKKKKRLCLDDAIKEILSKIKNMMPILSLMPIIS